MLKKLFILSLLASSQFVSAEVSQRKLLNFLKVMAVNSAVNSSCTTVIEKFYNETYDKKTFFSVANFLDAFVKTKFEANESDSRVKRCGKFTAKVLTSFAVVCQNSPMKSFGPNDNSCLVLGNILFFASAIFGTNNLVDWLTKEDVVVPLKEPETQETDK